MPRYKAVIFDCDGVLVDSETITNTLMQDSFAQHGLHLNLDEIPRLFVGGTIKGAAEKARELGADLPGDWVDTFYKHMFLKLAQGTPLIAGVLDVLDALDSAEIPYAVASNGPPAKMDITLGQHGLLDRFKGRLFSAHTSGSPKPAPGMLLAAAERLRVAPKDCVMVDDSPAGCIAARRAGMDCIGYAEETDPASLAAEGANVVHTMTQLATSLQLH